MKEEWETLHTSEITRYGALFNRTCVSGFNTEWAIQERVFLSTCSVRSDERLGHLCTSFSQVMGARLISRTKAQGLEPVLRISSGRES